MKNTVFVISIFLSFSLIEVKGQSQSVSDSLYTILVTGALTRKSQIASQLSPKYGFRYKYIKYNDEGGLVSAPNLDSIRKYNDSTNKLLREKLGENWKKTFDAEVDRMFENWVIVKDFLAADTSFKTLLRKLKLESYGAFIMIEEIQLDKIFVIEYMFYDREKHVEIDRKRFTVNLSISEVKLVN